MRTFDLYILRETLKPLGLALVIALLVLLIERLLRLLDLLLGAGSQPILPVNIHRLIPFRRRKP